MMYSRVLTQESIGMFRDHLHKEEKSSVTVEKYLRDVRKFCAFVRGRPVTKELVIAYKKELIRRQYAVNSVNSALASLRSFFLFLEWEDCRVRTLRRQRQIYCAQERELSREEYLRLLDAAREKPQLRLLLQTICGTGIRVSELQYFTVEAVKKGDITISCKNKTRVILIPGQLRKKLLNFALKRGISRGQIFVTRTGRPLDRSNIWKQMKQLCAQANVKPSKVFPHNLRKLFARTFYKIEKDIAKLADILGHSSINTTRIYIMSSGQEHRRKIEKLGLVV